MHGPFLYAEKTLYFMLYLLQIQKTVKSRFEIIISNEGIFFSKELIKGGRKSIVLLKYKIRR